MSEQSVGPHSPDLPMEPLLEILDRYRDEEGALIVVLQDTQEAYGYLPKKVVDVIAKAWRLSPAQVYAVATFYAQFTTTPRGKHVLRLCCGTACHVRGADSIKITLESELGIDAGETTPDNEFTLETVACMGACGFAPTMVIDDTMYSELTIPIVRRILKKLKEK